MMPVWKGPGKAVMYVDRVPPIPSVAGQVPARQLQTCGRRTHFRVCCPGSEYGRCQSPTALDVTGLKVFCGECTKVRRPGPASP